MSTEFKWVEAYKLLSEFGSSHAFELIDAYVAKLTNAARDVIDCDDQDIDMQGALQRLRGVLKEAQNVD